MSSDTLEEVEEVRIPWYWNLEETPHGWFFIWQVPTDDNPDAVHPAHPGFPSGEGPIYSFRKGQTLGDKRGNFVVDPHF